MLPKFYTRLESYNIIFNILLKEYNNISLLFFFVLNKGF
jgi:hypothetical protein